MQHLRRDPCKYKKIGMYICPEKVFIEKIIYCSTRIFSNFYKNWIVDFFLQLFEVGKILEKILNMRKRQTYNLFSGDDRFSSITMLF